MPLGHVIADVPAFHAAIATALPMVGSSPSASRPTRSWDALDAITDKDATGNAHAGEVIAVDTQNCFVRADGIRMALVGVEDLIVVASGTDVLIIPKGRSQEVKKIIEAMKSSD